MKKYILTILPMIMVSFSSFGTLNFNAGEERPGTCNIDILGVSEDEAISDMNAGFRPNVIVVEWNYGREQTTNQYDSEIIKPTMIPNKQGYKFLGWKVSGVKTCADFSTNELTCKSYKNCIWKDNTCVANPCVIADNDIYSYGEYDYVAGDCAYNVLQ